MSKKTKNGASKSSKPKKAKAKKPVDIHLPQSNDSIVGSDNPDFMEALIRDVYSCTMLSKDAPEELVKMRMNAAIETLKQIAPRDGVEGMLAVQMANTHQTATECLRRANVSGQTFEGRQMNLKHAEKFLRLYMDQVKTLNKIRGKGDQKMVIEHVNIEPGGQAIVGQIDSKK